MDGDFGDVHVAALVCDGSDGGIGSLGEDDGALLLAVLLGELGNSLCNLLDVGGSEVVRLGIGGRFALVGD